MSKDIAVRLDEALLQKLDELATAMGRSRNWLIAQALRDYVENNAEQVYAIKEALDDYRSGAATLVSHEEVMAGIEALFKE